MPRRVTCVCGGGDALDELFVRGVFPRLRPLLYLCCGEAQDSRAAGLIYPVGSADANMYGPNDLLFDL